MQKHKGGFSLVELSIVLVILGLLVGGVLTGQSLIRAAELRSVTTELQQFQTATQTFRDRFFAIPGDMRNAIDFWGEMSTGSCPNATEGAGTETCNGDGDGQLGPAAGANQFAERAAFWQHLANAGLIEGSFTGRVGSGGVFHNIIDVNAPRARIGNAGWEAFSRPLILGSSVLYDLPYGNAMQLGAPVTNSGVFDPAITPEEAWNIDTKIDDGLPASGFVIARYWNNLCSAADDGSHASSDFEASYRLSDDAIRCALIFRNLF